jgi:3-oxoacyl-[acyl-carrier protein] reductase
VDLGLNGAHVVIVGASRGIGRGMARRFAEEGAQLALIARNLKGLEKTAEQCRALGCGQVICAEANMESKDAVDAAFAEIGRHWGHVNVLVNNAANSVGTHGNFEKFADEALYESVFNRVTLGYVRTTRAALPLMKAAEWGRIVNVGSAGSADAAPMLHVYNMAKLALVSFNRATAREFAPLGISVNMLSPGGIMVENGNWGEVMNGYYAKLGLDPHSPSDAVELSTRMFGGPRPWMDRFGLIEEYATVTAFLGSRANSFMTGQDVAVQGGGAGGGG